jgi:hypothetical protein
MDTQYFCDSRDEFYRVIELCVVVCELSVSSVSLAVVMECSSMC